MNWKRNELELAPVRALHLPAGVNALLVFRRWGSVTIQNMSKGDHVITIEEDRGSKYSLRPLRTLRLKK